MEKYDSNNYIVTSPSGRSVIVKAKDPTQAKRVACKIWDIKTTDPWFGLTALKARKIKPSSVPIERNKKH